ncbi:MAG: hypothetical protein V4609_08355 [Pseudomonadota bacterium]
MSGVQGTQHTQPNHPMSQAQGSAASGQIDPRLAGVVRHAVIALPRLATDLSAVPHFPEKLLEARQASVVAES